MQIVYFNGKFLPSNKAKVSIFDRGFLYGEGVFETMRSYGGVVFQLEKHISRLSNSLKMLQINRRVSVARMRQIVYDLLRRNKLKNAYVKIIATKGTSRAQPTFLIYVLSYKPLPERFYEEGIRLDVFEKRLNAGSALAGHKTLNYLHNLLCRYSAEQKGFYDAVCSNTNGFVTETSRANIFLVKGKKIYTPCVKSGILPGITREEVIRIARDKLHTKVSERFVKLRQLHTADEIFLTNSLVELLPVSSIKGHIVGSGKAGPVTKALSGFYKAAVFEQCCKCKGQIG